MSKNSFNDLKAVDPEFTDKLYQYFESNSKYRTLENAATKNGLLNALETRRSSTDHLFVFDIDLTSVPVTNQKQSGRCWLFASLNVLNYQMIKNQNLENFEFSESYLYFWDKYEKANWFFTHLLKNPNDLDEGHFRYYLDHPQGDGGHWDLTVALIQKYGLLPKEIYPESVDSSNSRLLNFYLNKLLRQNAGSLLKAAKTGEDVSPLLETALQEVFNFLAVSLGLPPKNFDYVFRDKDKNLKKFSGTALDFYNQFVGLDLEDYASIVSLPLQDHPYGKSMTTEYAGNVVGGHSLKHLNIREERINELILRQLKSEEPVFFGCDVLQESSREAGLLSRDVYDFKNALDIEFSQTKRDRLFYRDADISHAMVIVGVAFDKSGKPENWKIQNSWGDANGNKGYFVASEDWMETHAYNLVVRKAFLTEEERAAYEAEPIVYEPWDAVW